MIRQVDARTGIQIMDHDECLALLTGEHVGRLAVIHRGSPMIYPLNYLLDGDDIVFGSDPGPKVKPATGAVCFEVDRLDARTHEGWSVVVPGRVEEVIPHRQPAWPRILALPLEAWTGQKKRRFRIVADRITGRRVGPSA